MRHSIKLILPTLALAIAACGKNDTAGKSDEGATLSTPAGDGSTAATIHLVVQGGPHPGTYDAKSDDITCTYGFAGPGSWGNQYSVTGKGDRIQLAAAHRTGHQGRGRRYRPVP